MTQFAGTVGHIGTFGLGHVLSPASTTKIIKIAMMATAHPTYPMSAIRLFSFIRLDQVKPNECDNRWSNNQENNREGDSNPFAMWGICLLDGINPKFIDCEYHLNDEEYSSDRGKNYSDAPYQ